MFSFLLEELLAQGNSLLDGHPVATQLPVIYLHGLLFCFWGGGGGGGALSFISPCATLNPNRLVPGS